MFVLEKRLLEKYPKKDRELIIDAMKKGFYTSFAISFDYFFSKTIFLGVQQLAKIKHPRILSLQHPLEESRFII